MQHACQPFFVGCGLICVDYIGKLVHKVKENPVCASDSSITLPDGIYIMYYVVIAAN